MVNLHPGWVETDMTGPQALLSPKESVNGMISVINTLQTKDSGTFIRHDGQRLAW